MAIPEYEITGTIRNGHRITHVYVPAFGRYLEENLVMQYLRPPKTANFFVRGALGQKAYVGIYGQLSSRPYLRTFADRTWTDNLLSLPSRQAA